MAAGLFWLSVAMVAFAYGGYLVALVGIEAVQRLRRTSRLVAGPAEQRTPDERPWPKVSVLIAAHDEAAVIDAKIENTLALEYPSDRLEILIGSDGSKDGTDERVSAHAGRGVVLSAAARAGKASVLNRLARRATGRVLLFTDANTMLAPDALQQLVSRLDDPTIGGACGRLRLVSSGGAAAEGAYWRYECLLKAYESRCGTIVGANGGLYALRADEWRELPPDTIVDDFLASMRVVLAGRRVVYVPTAVGVEEAGGTAEEFRRRVRIATGNFQSLRVLWPILFRPDFAAFALWGHKLVRWSVPAWMLLAWLACVPLLDRPIYAASFVAAPLVAVLAWLASGVRGAAFVRHFLAMNAALVLGFVRFAAGRGTATWQRTGRTGVPKTA